jgi:hypothetical protein
MYVLAPNMGIYYLTGDSEAPIDTIGGTSMIVDHRGHVVGAQRYGGVSTNSTGPCTTSTSVAWSLKRARRTR